jgi:hypothetical protein
MKPDLVFPMPVGVERPDLRTRRDPLLREKRIGFWILIAVCLCFLATLWAPGLQRSPPSMAGASMPSSTAPLATQAAQIASPSPNIPTIPPPPSDQLQVVLIATRTPYPTPMPSGPPPTPHVRPAPTPFPVCGEWLADGSICRIAIAPTSAVAPSIPTTHP